MSTNHGQATALTVITPIKEGHREKLLAVLEAIRTNPNSPVKNIHTIHYARWVVIDKGTRLLFTSNFDGPLDAYLDEFIEKAAPGLDAIWSNCEGYPAGGAIRADDFKAYVRKYEVDAAFFYASYPDVTVKQVQKALRIQAKFDEFLQEFSS